MNSLIERFMRYVKIDTQADPQSESYPSTAKQLDLARLLKQELRELGLQDVQMDEYGYVTAKLPANTDKKVPAIGFLAHLDTSPDAPGAQVQARLISNYDGKDILLNPETGMTLSPEQFPTLRNYIGQSLIVTDGNTLLGGDDKAGVAAIMNALEYLIQHPEIKHGKLCVGFTLDEEIGHGVKHFNVPAFQADFAFTVDGGERGEFEYETFNAATAKVKITGRSVHPGLAKGFMRNACQIAQEFHTLLPVAERPEYTAEREGFIHLGSMHGNVEEAELEYILRDHDEALQEAKKQTLQRAAEFINARYNAPIVQLKIEDQYFNMRKMIEAHPEILDLARRAYHSLGIETREIAVRGGTDGSRLSFMGLPCPNLFTGGHNCHGRYEYVVVESMQEASMLIVKIAELAAQ